LHLLRRTSADAVAINREPGEPFIGLLEQQRARGELEPLAAPFPIGRVTARATFSVWQVKVE
jgi:hypothetical protein